MFFSNLDCRVAGAWFHQEGQHSQVFLVVEGFGPRAGGNQDVVTEEIDNCATVTIASRS